MPDAPSAHGRPAAAWEPRGSGPQLLAGDEADADLIRAVHPPDWVNPTPAARYDLVVLGAGTAGLVAAAGAAGLGARVALVERGLMGGDCLNAGCVPSKSLLHSARAAAAGPPAGDAFAAAMARLRRVRAGLGPHDGAERFAMLGVDVFLGEGRFGSREHVEVAGERLRFRRALIATGGRPARLDLPGLDDSGYLTNETVFTLTRRPEHLVILGGGPVGCEMAQAFRRLGSEVTLVQRAGTLLEKEDADAAAVVGRRLVAEGVRILTGVTARRISGAAPARAVQLEGGHAPLPFDALLVAAGRVPNVEELGLEAAGVAVDPVRGVVVDGRLRTTNPRIHAAGDVTGLWQLTHAADAMARIVIQNALFGGRKLVSSLIVPRATLTDPELAHVGLTAAEAAKSGTRLDSFTVPLADVDRCVLEDETEGFLRVHLHAGSDRIAGATAVGRHAGEIIGELSLAMTSGLRMRHLARTIRPYPTRSQALGHVADAWSRTRLTPFTRALLRGLLVLRR